MDEHKHPSREPSSHDKDEITGKTTDPNQILPQYNVILFNDDVHHTSSVAWALCQCMNIMLHEAGKIMKEAHTSGQAVICTTHYERAEHICYMLQDDHGLDVVIEPIKE